LVVNAVAGNRQLCYPRQLPSGPVAAGGALGATHDATKKHSTYRRPTGFFPHGFDFVALDIATIPAKSLRVGIDP